MASFVFVPLDGVSSTNDQDTRKAIRRQAMSQVKSSRQRQTDLSKRRTGDQYVNIAAKPDRAPNRDDDDLHQDGTKADRSLVIADYPDSYLSDPWRKVLESIPPRPRSIGYEGLRMKYDFDVPDLSGFTTFYMSRADARPLLGHPSRILSAFRSRQWSFLSFIPARFGSSKCCDDAVRCVAAACHSINVGADPRSADVLALYGRALHSLQDALYDPHEKLKPDTLCAVDLLAIYELLNMADEQDMRWASHVVGAAQLLDVRCPYKEKTDFEESLMLAQTGPIFVQALVERRFPFIDRNEWQLALTSLTCSEKSPFANGKETIFCLWKCAYYIPKLLNEVNEAINNDFDARYGSHADSLFQQARELRRRMNKGFINYNAACSITRVETLHQFTETTLDASLEALAICLTGAMTLNRLLVAIKPAADDAEVLEDETQRMARCLLNTAYALRPTDPKASRSKESKLDTAEAFVSSEYSWRLVIDAARSSERLGLRLRMAFEQWITFKDHRIFDVEET